MSCLSVFFQLFGFGISTPLLTDISKETNGRKVRFVVISDTHNLHKELEIPEGDVIIHAGDFTNHGSLEEVQNFGEWFRSLPHKTKLLVPGNHDMIMDREYYKIFWSDWASRREVDEESHLVEALEGIRVLVGESIQVGGVHVYGAPWVPVYAKWRTAFNRDPAQIGDAWATIPGARQPTVVKLNIMIEEADGVDVLVTHTPPYGILDRAPHGAHMGCPALAPHVEERIRPRFHVFGHVHADCGAVRRGGTVFINASAVSDAYVTRRPAATVFDVDLE
eukprot:CAMPEP_0113726236 /NCGR_PEP_ID=MMETSP0038_2-20120614/40287_1 /TAXON_ID=2898 /ORGANISM="Cryptomonas paramecium" /LENGTH=277 /DNA_ID=CAMNT_0000656755 /DNA_START=163 /DNA_END=997 /DNA_ORIENTATION=- /assembly_acc=CAM_ASM_000170